eukprot:GDKJ01004694.1.p1 GENE.GDKJ01004694.1~~GDKJ01004694.1.p1  ORF type:complete len:140 (-),score=14.00 GDKJ01004694.1:119-538(-)
MSWADQQLFRLNVRWRQLAVSNPNITLEQFLREDIRTTSEGNNFSFDSIVGHFPKGAHYFQVLSVMDASNPHDKQTNSNSKLLALSDGVQTLSAFEVLPWNIHINDLQPGTKIFIKGQPPCHLGTVHLTRSHIVLLFSA